MVTKIKAVERLPGRCPHCDGTYVVTDGVNKCVACSRSIEGIQDMKSYYLKNKPAILADIKLQGSKAARKAWKIPAGTMNGLLARWSRNGTPTPAPAKTPAIKAGLPSFPAFDSSWTEAVALRWLEIWLYLEVKRREEVKNVD